VVEEDPELAGQMFEDKLELDRKLKIKIQPVLFVIADVPKKASLLPLGKEDFRSNG